MPEILQEKDFFGTTDINLHATLRYYGYHTKAIDKNDTSRAVFYTKRDSVLDGLIQQYFAHELLVEPLAFATILKEIKTQLFHS